MNSQTLAEMLMPVRTGSFLIVTHHLQEKNAQLFTLQAFQICGFAT